MKKLFLITIIFASLTLVAFGQKDVIKPISNPPVTKDLLETLKASGNYKTLIIVIGKVGLENLGLKKDSKEQITFFAPNDAAFAKLPKADLDALMKDPVKMKNLLLLHTVRGKVMIADLLVALGDGSVRTYKELKSLQGRVMGFQCNGHTGEHHPRFDGEQGKIGKGDILFNRGIIHEIDTVMASDYLFAGPGGGPR